MGGSSFMCSLIQIMIFLLSSLNLQGTSCRTDNIVFENRNFRYEIDRTGKNLSFIDKASGISYLYEDSVSYAAYLEKDGNYFNVTAVSRLGNRLRYEFGVAGVTADMQVEERDDRVIFKLVSVRGDPESLTFINVPLNLEGMTHEPFGACILAMNLLTHVIQLPALQTHLIAKAYRYLGMENAEVTMLGVPQADILPVIRDVIKNSEDIPFSDKGGAWALMTEDGYGSYLMNTGASLTEETVDEWIEMCRSLGFNQIDNHGGGAFFKFGCFEINKEKFPDGWESFTRINNRLREAGISPMEGSWLRMEKRFDPLINLENHQALGVWIKGDGNGQLLNFRIGNPKHIGYAGVRGDHFVDVDFTGWKYFELVEIESTRFSDYIWEQPVETREIPEGFNVYNSYKGTVALNSVDKLQIWYNNLPANTEVNCIIGPVKALPIVPVTIKNPTISIGGKTIVFPVKMESGMYIEFNSPDDCKLYGPRGERLREIKIEGEVPVLMSGHNEVSFNCDGPQEISSRVQVTIIAEGNPL